MNVSGWKYSFDLYLWYFR